MLIKIAWKGTKQHDTYPRVLKEKENKTNQQLISMFIKTNNSYLIKKNSEVSMIHHQ